MLDGQKLLCVNDDNQKTLKAGKIYTVDTTLGTTPDRVYVKEWKRFSFSKDRFELAEEQYAQHYLQQ